MRQKMVISERSMARNGKAREVAGDSAERQQVAREGGSELDSKTVRGRQ
jgi:hypothetical protein